MFHIIKNFRIMQNTIDQQGRSLIYFLFKLEESLDEDLLVYYEKQN